MRITKSRALELIDEKISQFEEIIEKSPHYVDLGPLFEKYKEVHLGTVHLVVELFSEEEAKKFEAASGDMPKYESDVRYKSKKCLFLLKSYRDRIQKFWPDDKSEITKKIIIPFVSMSFSEKDSDINKYFTGILDALQIDFETGERYSKESIPEKVKNRIKSCDLLIGILVKRYETINGRFKTPEWLIKEIGIAQGAGKDVIVLVERGVTDIAGLKSEKEIIYFERGNSKEIQTATLKFLEALKEHGLT